MPASPFMEKEPAAACPPRIPAAKLRFLLSFAAGGLFALVLVALPTLHLPSRSLFFSPAGVALPAGPSPPRFAYLISGADGDAGMLRRCLLALYHPRNSYVLHLDAEAPDAARAELAAFVAAHPVLSAARNIRVVQKANTVTYRGPTMVTNTLHAAAILLWGDGGGRGADWDWFVVLSASDYPLVTQDDLMHVFSKLPRDLNFIEHTSNVGWKASGRAMPLIVDPGFYSSKKVNLMWIHNQTRQLPTAFRLFTGSAWTVLSKPFVEYLIWGWDNLPRSLLLYHANFIETSEHYFQTVVCNADESIRNTTVNHDLHYISWDDPPRQHPRYLSAGDWDRMVGSGAPFARKFRRDDAVLDRIDAEILSRGRGDAVAPGGWSAGDTAHLQPGPGAARLGKLISSLLSPETFRENQCKISQQN